MGKRALEAQGTRGPPSVPASSTTPGAVFGAVAAFAEQGSHDGTVHDDAEVGGGRQHKRPVADEQRGEYERKAGSRTAGHGFQHDVDDADMAKHTAKPAGKNDQCGDVEHTGDAAAVEQLRQHGIGEISFVAAPHGVEGGSSNPYRHTLRR